MESKCACKRTHWLFKSRKKQIKYFSYVSRKIKGTSDGLTSSYGETTDNVHFSLLYSYSVCIITDSSFSTYVTWCQNHQIKSHLLTRVTELLYRQRAVNAKQGGETMRSSSSARLARSENKKTHFHHPLSNVWKRCGWRILDPHLLIERSVPRRRERPYMKYKPCFISVDRGKVFEPPFNNLSLW